MKKARVRRSAAAGLRCRGVGAAARSGGGRGAKRYCISVIAVDIVAIATATERELRFAARPRSPFN